MWHGKGKHKNEKSMCKSEIFAEILKIVSQETEIAIDRILSSDKDSETVDARYLIVLRVTVMQYPFLFGLY